MKEEVKEEVREEVREEMSEEMSGRGYILSLVAWNILIAQ